MDMPDAHAMEFVACFRNQLRHYFVVAAGSRIANLRQFL
jgi:hypothetical protein